MTDYQALKPSTLLNPVPAVLVTCRGVSPDSRPNALTIAWAGTVNSDPPMVSISVRPGRFSHPLIAESGEFAVHLVDEAHCEDLDYCGVRSGRDEDKLAARGLKALPAEGLDYAPALAGFPACLSCKVRQRIPLGSHDLFIGEVVATAVRPDLLDPDGSLHLERARLICYAHGLYQQAADVLGFFGYSVARPDVRERRLAAYR